MKIDEMLEKYCKNGVRFYKLDEIVDFLNGKGHEKNIVENGRYIVVNSKFISTDGDTQKFSNEQICPVYKDDILMVMSDLPNGRALAKCFYVEDDDKYTLNQRICALRVKDKDLINIRFLYYCLNRNRQLLRYDNGVDQTNLRKDDILNIRVAVPPLEVQCKIVHILDDFTVLSAELSAELKARKKQYNFYKDKIFNISEKTNYVEIKDILQEQGYIRGPFGSALRKSDMVKNGVPIYEQQHAIYNHRNFRYFISNEKANGLARFMVKDGDIILSCSGTVGRTSIIKSVDEKGIINQALLILRVDPNKINVRFLEHFLNSSYGRKKILSNTNGSAQVNICKREEFEKIKIPLPKMDEQNEIVNILDRFDKLCNDISEGLPAEIEARQKQYEYYRDKLLTFKELKSK